MDQSYNEKSDILKMSRIFFFKDYITNYYQRITLNRTLHILLSDVFLKKYGNITYNYYYYYYYYYYLLISLYYVMTSWKCCRDAV